MINVDFPDFLIKDEASNYLETLNFTGGLPRQTYLSPVSEESIKSSGNTITYGSLIGLVLGLSVVALQYNNVHNQILLIEAFPLKHFGAA